MLENETFQSWIFALFSFFLQDMAPSPHHVEIEEHRQRQDQI